MLARKLLYLAGILLALTGCTSGPSAVLIGDFAGVPSGRLSVSLTKQDEAPSIAQSGHALEGSWTGARGSDMQQLETGDEDVIFGGQTFVAPIELRNEYNFKYGEALYRWRTFFGQSQTWGLEVLGGVGHAIFNVRTSAPAQTASMKFNTTGLALGVGGIWKFRPETSLQVRLSGFFGEDEGVSSATRLDVHLQHSLARYVAVRGGITNWFVSVNRFQSDVRASIFGPAVALEITF